jgi:toxin secretion/phage lysis holin
MNIKEFSFNALVAGIGAAVSAWLGGWDIALTLLVALMVLDYITGFLGAVKQERVNSNTMFWGGIRKGLILAVVVVAVLLDELVGNPEPILRTLVIYFYVAREGLSVTENLGKLGVPLPPMIVRVLEQLQTKGGSK